MSYAEVLIGTKFGRLTPLSRYSNKWGKPAWTCECDCGNKTIVSAASLKSGQTKSCGCLSRELRGSWSKTHGLSGHPLFQIWFGMIARCTNPKRKNWIRYGGRGISVCDRWMNLENFIADMYPSFQAGKSIDREDNDGNYCPENCRWADSETQSNNKYNNRKLEFNGILLGCCQWNRRLGFKRGLVASRVRLGWSVERILTTPQK